MGILIRHRINSESVVEGLTISKFSSLSSSYFVTVIQRSPLKLNGPDRELSWDLPLTVIGPQVEKFSLWSVPTSTDEYLLFNEEILSVALGKFQKVVTRGSR